MRKYYMLLSLLFFSLFLISATARAADYEVAMQVEEEIILEIKTAEKDQLKVLYGDDWGDNYLFKDKDEVGMKSKMEIKDVDEESIKLELGSKNVTYDTFYIQYDWWDWTNDEFQKDPDKNEEIAHVAVNPEDQYDMPNFIPVPVADYIENMKEDQVCYLYSQDDYSTTANSISLQVETSEGKDVILTWTYDSSQGYLSSFKIEDADGHLVYECGTSAIPGYNLSIFLGIGLISLVGLVFLQMKKNR